MRLVEQAGLPTTGRHLLKCSDAQVLGLNPVGSDFPHHVFWVDRLSLLFLRDINMRLEPVEYGDEPQ